VGKEERPRLEPRILLEDAAHSYHAARRVSEADRFDNMLIQGDNLLALKALEQDFTGRVKCVYIDPPFNTGQAFQHYDDGVEHSLWLSLLRDRLEILHRLLADDGTLFIHIDDNELAYLVVASDEIFGRNNRMFTVTFKQGAATGHKAINPGCVNITNFVLIYAKSKEQWRPRRLFTGRERDKRYSSFIINVDDPYQDWRIISLADGIARSLGISAAEFRRLAKNDPAIVDRFVVEHHRAVIRLAQPDYDAVSSAARLMIDESRARPNTILRLGREAHSDMYFCAGQRILFYTDKLKRIDGEWVAGEPLTTLWDDLLSNNLHNEGGVDFPKGKKPESLVRRAIDLATRPGDLVLDFFLGSGTTAAVAHKMGRRWIGIELGDHAVTHCVPRLRKVVDGTDPGGVTESAGWKGGGGFRFYRLAPSLLERDAYGQWVISEQYNPAMLAEAVCKLEGFRYEPSPVHYWQHGRSTENDFIYVTTQTLTHEQLRALSVAVGAGRTLLVCCAAYQGRADAFENLEVKRMPHAVLGRCKWGRDDYSLQVAALPPAAPAATPATPGTSAEPTATAKGTRGRARPAPANQMGLFERGSEVGDGDDGNGGRDGGQP